MLIIHIHNDGTGDITTGNYEYSVYINRTPIAHGHIEKHRRSDGWEQLAIKVAKDSTQQRWIKAATDAGILQDSCKKKD